MTKYRRAVLLSKQYFLTHKIRLIKMNVFHSITLETHKMVMMPTAGKLKVLLAVSERKTLYDTDSFKRLKLPVDRRLVHGYPRTIKLRQNTGYGQGSVCGSKQLQNSPPSLGQAESLLFNDFKNSRCIHGCMITQLSCVCQEGIFLGKKSHSTPS